MSTNFFNLQSFSSIFGLKIVEKNSPQFFCFDLIILFSFSLYKKNCCFLKQNPKKKIKTTKFCDKKHPKNFLLELFSACFFVWFLFFSFRFSSQKNPEKSNKDEKQTKVESCNCRCRLFACSFNCLIDPLSHYSVRLFFRLFVSQFFFIFFFFS